VAPALAGAPPPRIRFDGPAGTFDVELDAVAAPLTVHNILRLIDSGYYAAADAGAPLRWHRVVPNFVLQTGDPRGGGSGGPGYSIRDEINRLRYGRGTVDMARSGPNTGGSQFFITRASQSHLDGADTIFGRVLDGMPRADLVLQDDPLVIRRGPGAAHGCTRNRWRLSRRRTPRPATV
jgi:peptidyl-prolyl cis-trans isomerase B (cyclophilin B)